MKLTKLTGLVLTALLCLCLVCAFPGEAHAAEAPQPVPYTAPAPITDLVYTGSAQALITAGSCEYGTISYALDGGTYSDTIPTATNAGSYTVNYFVQSNDTSAYASREGSLTVEIAKASVTFSYQAPSPKTDLVYSGLPHNLVNPGSVNFPGAKILYSVSSAKDTIPGSFSENIPQERDAGTYYVYWMIDGGRNYEDMSASDLFQASDSPVKVTIGPATISVNGAENTAKNYDGSTEGPTGLLLTADILPGSVPVDATIISATYASADAGEDIDLSISYRLNGSNCVLSDGGTEGSITVKGSIKPCPIEITPKAEAIHYGDALPEFDYSVTNGSIVGDYKPSLSYSSSYRQFDSVGTYSISATLDSTNPNYDVTVAAGTLTVKPKTLEFSGIVPATKIYDGTDSIDYSWSNGVFTGLVNNEKARLELPVADHSVKLASSDVGKDVELILPDWHKLIITGGNANPDNYDLKFTDRVDILPFEFTLLPDENQSKTYSEDDPEFTYTYSPKNALSNGVNWNNIKLQRDSGDDAGSYAFTVAANTTESNFTFKIADNAPEFVIKPFLLQYTNSDISPLPEREYTGQALSGRTDITVTLHNGEQYLLMPDDDYTLSGGTATALGTHSSTITGKGNFDGELSYSWKIVPPAIIEEVLNDSITSSNVTLDDAEELRLLEQALNTVTDSTSASSTDKQDWQTAATKLAPIMEKLKELEIPAWQKLLDKYEPLLDDIEKDAQADDLKLRKEYEELKKQLDAELKALPEADAKKAGEALKKQLERIHEALYDYYIMTGNGQYWYSSSDNKLCFKINGAYALFDSVRVDGKTLDRSCYTAASGSTIITFNDSFTKTLSDGEHRISIIYNDGAATGVFYVNPRGYVATGDGTEPALYLLVMALSTAGAALSFKGLKRSKE